MPPVTNGDEEQRISRLGKAGLLLAPVLAVGVYLAIPGDAAGDPASGLSQPGRAVAAVGVLMAALWVTEALPIPITALLPLALFPLLTQNEVTIREAAAPYAHELIFLFMGGFMIALAMQRCNLHRRIALGTILLVGTRPRRLVAGFMAASAFLSMWVSNTATVVMMLPIAISVIELVRRHLAEVRGGWQPTPGAPFHFAICLLLGIAYAASIGGIGTLIGTPPNLLLAAFLSDEYGVKISFARWMAVGIPLVVTFLPLSWLLLTRVVYPIRLPGIPGGRDLILREFRAMGPMSRGEKTVAVVFFLTAVCWITRPYLLVPLKVAGVAPLAGLTDTGIAMAGALLLFVFPVDWKKGVFALSWRHAVALPWGILLLFGGGLSLASAITATGVAEFLGHRVGAMAFLPLPVLMAIVIVLIMLVTELTSNTATVAAFLPILGAVSVGLNVNPILLTVPAAIAASCAFMMPVATPPNALVFSSGEITVPQMCKAGVWLDLPGIALIMAVMYGIAVHVLRITVNAG